MVLEEYKDIVGACAGIVTMGQMFSGVFVCKEIYSRGSSNHLPPMTFLAGYIISTLFYEQGLLLQDETMGFINLLGLIITVIYLVWYYLYLDGDHKNEFWKQFAKSTLFIAVLIGYAELQERDVAEFRFGIIMTVLMILLMAMPLKNLPEIIRTKNAECLPFPMIATGVVVSVNWLLYGIIIKKDVIVYQNVYCFVMSLLQLFICLKYPGPGTNKNKKE